MLCKQCGSNIPDNIKFCPQCGSPIAQPQPAQVPFQQSSAPEQPYNPYNGYEPYGSAPQPPKAKSHTGLIIGIVAVLLVAVIAVVAAVFLLSDDDKDSGSRESSSHSSSREDDDDSDKAKGRDDKDSKRSRDPEEVIDEFVGAVFDGDIDTVLGLLPEEIADTFEDDGSADEIEDSIAELQEYYDEQGLELEYEIAGTDDVSKRELKELQEFYADDFDLEITDAQIVEVEASLTSGDIEETSTEEFIVIEVDGIWYIDVESCLEAFF